MTTIPFDVLTDLDTGRDIHVAADLVVHENTWEVFGRVDPSDAIALAELFAKGGEHRVRMFARGHEEELTHEGTVIVANYAPSENTFRLLGSGPPRLVTLDDRWPGRQTEA